MRRAPASPAPPRSTPPCSTASSRRSRTQIACASLALGFRAPLAGPGDASWLRPACAVARRPPDSAVRSRSHRPCASSARISTRVFGAPIMERGVWARRRHARSTPASASTAQRRQADDAGVEHEDPDARGGGRARSGGTTDSRRRSKRAAPIDDGVLQGDLIVRSNGDPTINSAERPRGRGVRRVGARAAGGGHLLDRRPHRRRRSGVRRRGASGRAGPGTTCRTDTRRRSARSSSTRTSPTLTVVAGRSAAGDPPS